MNEYRYTIHRLMGSSSLLGTGDIIEVDAHDVTIKDGVVTFTRWNEDDIEIFVGTVLLTDKIAITGSELTEDTTNG